MKLKEKNVNVVLTIVQGDTMSALAGAEAAFYHRIPVAHVEAGLRTHLKYSPFPEELNRKQISSLATLHFAVSKLSEDNLKRENIHENIEVVGNTVIDQIQASLAYEMDNQTRRNLEELFPNTFEKSSTGQKKRIILVTLHRRENHGQNLRVICNGLMQLSVIASLNIRIIFALHPNPIVQQPIIDLLGLVDGIMLTRPLPYLTLVHVLSRVDFVFTDSGGLQEEALSLGKKVLVLRDSTDRPEGNPVVLEHFDLPHFIKLALSILANNSPDAHDKDLCSEDDSTCIASDLLSRFSNSMPYGDGKAANRISKKIFDFLDSETRKNISEVWLHHIELSL